jgi:thymidylate synthase ThyX
MPVDHFTPEEQKILSPYMTNMDKSIFALKNLPEVVMGALFSRYSRSTKSLRRVLLEEFINKPEMGFKDIVNYDIAKGSDELVAIKKAEEFYDRVLVGYGDDSVAELAGAHIAIEDVSIIGSKLLEDARIGISPLEKSTRYVYFDQKPDGRYLYYDEPTLMASSYAGLYRKTMDHLFDTYSQLIPKVTAFVTERFPKDKDATDRAYASAVRAKTCDLLRGILPAGTITNLGLFGNGRAFEYLITKMYANPLKESQDIAATMQEELGKVIPSFVKRSNNQHGKEQQAFYSETAKAVEELAKEFAEKPEPQPPVVLVHYDPNVDAEVKAVAAILYSTIHLPLPAIITKVKKLMPEQRKKIIDEYCMRRKNRRHKPGRAFENIYYTFDVTGNYGMFRDLHRHRVMSQERQLLSTHNGYDLPHELVEAGFDDDFMGAMERAKLAYDEVSATHPKEAQYLVPLAYKIRWYMTMNLREAYHFAELRSMIQGHIDYRRIAQQIYVEIKRVHPNLAEHMKYVDMAEHGLERIEAEKKTDKKLEELDKKYGTK